MELKIGDKLMFQFRLCTFGIVTAINKNDFIVEWEDKKYCEKIDISDTYTHAQLCYFKIV